ncbi:hypothetical protein Pmani_025295 [Petrolisthes manimaculis]|uniref:Uncharacterized protein n=1 Tax=Petrolisthes manimaculis TaxID=1843537 RepID=A0AAE1P815_9EUCA|nr:hypothetical protein Pmani_025295 [Petrolisthes manimaculis]
MFALGQVCVKVDWAGRATSVFFVSDVFGKVDVEGMEMGELKGGGKGEEMEGWKMERRGEEMDGWKMERRGEEMDGGRMERRGEEMDGWMEDRRRGDGGRMERRGDEGMEDRRRGYGVMEDLMEDGKERRWRMERRCICEET